MGGPLEDYHLSFRFILRLGMSGHFTAGSLQQRFVPSSVIILGDSLTI